MQQRKEKIKLKKKTVSPYSVVEEGGVYLSALKITWSRAKYTHLFSKNSKRPTCMKSFYIVYIIQMIETEGDMLVTLSTK